MDDNSLAQLIEISHVVGVNPEYVQAAGGNTSVSYTADDVLFPALAGGDILTWAVLVSDTGSPATDVILAAWPIVRITDGSDVPLTITTSLIQFPVT